jgi:hypothetical protein
MSRANLICTLMVILSALGVLAVPAHARFESTGPQNFKSFGFMPEFVGGGISVTCSKITGTYEVQTKRESKRLVEVKEAFAATKSSPATKIVEGGVAQTVQAPTKVGAHLLLSVGSSPTNWEACAAKIAASTVDVRVRHCDFQVEQETKFNLGTGSIAKDCILETPTLGCTVKLSVEGNKLLKQVGLGGEPNLTAKVEMRGLTTTASAAACGAAGVEGTKGATFTTALEVENLKVV